VREHVLEDGLGTAPLVHGRLDQRLVVGTQLRNGGVKGESGGADARAVIFGRDDRGMMAAAAKLEAERDGRVEITQRAEGGQQDPHSEPGRGQWSVGCAAWPTATSAGRRISSPIR
jgi:hypothetical protein